MAFVSGAFGIFANFRYPPSCILWMNLENEALKGASSSAVRFWAMIVECTFNVCRTIESDSGINVKLTRLLSLLSCEDWSTYRRSWPLCRAIRTVWWKYHHRTWFIAHTASRRSAHLRHARCCSRKELYPSLLLKHAVVCPFWICTSVCCEFREICGTLKWARRPLLQDDQFEFPFLRGCLVCSRLLIGGPWNLCSLLVS